MYYTAAGRLKRQILYQSTITLFGIGSLFVGPRHIVAPTGPAGWYAVEATSVVTPPSLPTPRPPHHRPFVAAANGSVETKTKETSV